MKTKKSPVTERLEARLVRQEAEGYVRDAELKRQRAEARKKVREDWSEVKFRTRHPIKALKTWWRHKLTGEHLLHRLYEADQAK